MAQVKVYVTLKPTVLDAQGSVVASALQQMGYKNVGKVRMGKYLELEISENGSEIDAQVKEMCERLLANPVIEDYRYEISK